jgi:hypothetical protein
MVVMYVDGHNSLGEKLTICWMKMIKNNLGELRNGSQQYKKLEKPPNSHSDLDNNLWVKLLGFVSFFENQIWLNTNINNRETFLKFELKFSFKLFSNVTFIVQQNVV